MERLEPPCLQRCRCLRCSHGILANSCHGEEERKKSYLISRCVKGRSKSLSALYCIHEIADAHDLASEDLIDKGKRVSPSHPVSFRSFELTASDCCGVLQTQTLPSSDDRYSTDLLCSITPESVFGFMVLGICCKILFSRDLDELGST